MISRYAIEISDLQYGITDNEPIIHIDELLIEERSIVTILGPSGCGKSTFLFLLSGLLPSKNGAKIRLAKRTITDAVNSGLVSISFQTPVLMPWRTASQNVSLALELKGRSVQAQVVDKALDRVELNRNRHEYYPEALSSGMRSRVAVAQAMVSQAKILLMDEVFGTLDEATRVKMNLMVRSINSSQMRATIIFVTHSIDEALLLGDRILIFQKLQTRGMSSILFDTKVELQSRTRETRYTSEFLSQKKEIERIFFDKELE